MNTTVQDKSSTVTASGASLGYSLAMLKMFLNNGFINKEEYDQIEAVVEKHYNNA